MQIDTDTLPNDPALLQQMLRTAVHQQGELHAENDKLRLLIQRLTRHQFGRWSEQLTADQLQFGLEDLEQTVAENQAGQDATQDAGGAGPQPAARATRPLRITARCPPICRATRWLGMLSMADLHHTTATRRHVLLPLRLR